MTDYRRNGKQVLANDLHFADARDENAAALIVRALGLFAATRSIVPDWAKNWPIADTVAPSQSFVARPLELVGPDEC